MATASHSTNLSSCKGSLETGKTISPRSRPSSLTLCLKRK
uniref:Uncharacterized protein n=1 Tax=Knipowitschia caucasica TaxID=637954 RepID=A0AAV2L7B7_KNICA